MQEKKDHDRKEGAPWTEGRNIMEGRIEGTCIMKRRKEDHGKRGRKIMKEALDGVLCPTVPGPFWFCVPCPFSILVLCPLSLRIQKS